MLKVESFQLHFKMYYSKHASHVSFTQLKNFQMTNNEIILVIKN